MLNVWNVFIFLGDFKLSLVTLDVISFVCIPSICIGVLQGNDDGDDDDDDDDDGDDDDNDDDNGGGDDLSAYLPFALSYFKGTQFSTLS